jgi:hypothetical protein
MPAAISPFEQHTGYLDSLLKKLLFVFVTQINWILEIKLFKIRETSGIKAHKIKIRTCNMFTKITLSWTMSEKQQNFSLFLLIFEKSLKNVVCRNVTLIKR